MFYRKDMIYIYIYIYIYITHILYYVYVLYIYIYICHTCIKWKGKYITTKIFGWRKNQNLLTIKLFNNK